MMNVERWNLHIIEKLYLAMIDTLFTNGKKSGSQTKPVSREKINKFLASIVNIFWNNISISEAFYYFCVQLS